MSRSKTLRVTAAVMAASGSSMGALVMLSNPASASSSTLTDGQTLTGGQELVAGSYTLIMQTDGNLVEYLSGNAVWQTYTAGEPGNRLAMQTDGNLVEYGSANQVRWQTHTQGYGGDDLALQSSDGNIVVYSSGGSALWAKSWTQQAAGSQAYAQVIMPSYGWSAASQFGYLNDLWTRESNWEWNVCNGGSTYPSCNYNGVAYGIPQSLPGDKMASAGSDWATDGETQVQWGLNYILSEYGSPAAAWAHEESYGWYVKKAAK
jgi:hypothetical protein